MTRRPLLDQAEMLRIIGRKVLDLTPGWHQGNRDFLQLVLDEAIVAGGSARSLCARIKTAQTTVDRWTRQSPGALGVKAILDEFRVTCALYIYAHGFTLEQVNYAVGFDSPTSLQRMVDRVAGYPLQELAKRATWEQYLGNLLRQLRSTSGAWRKPHFLPQRPPRTSEGGVLCTSTS